MNTRTATAYPATSRMSTVLERVAPITRTSSIPQSVHDPGRGATVVSRRLLAERREAEVPALRLGPVELDPPDRPDRHDDRTGCVGQVLGVRHDRHEPHPRL